MYADDADRAPSERDPDLDALIDLANLEVFLLWVSSGGFEQGLSRSEIKAMSAEERHDQDVLMRLYGPLARRHRKAKEGRDKQRSDDKRRSRR